MDRSYLVYSAQGWWGSGTFTSDLTLAKRFTREEAIDFCRRRYNPLGSVTITVAVDEADILEILKP